MSQPLSVREIPIQSTFSSNASEATEPPSNTPPLNRVVLSGEDQVTLNLFSGHEARITDYFVAEPSELAPRQVQVHFRHYPKNTPQDLKNSPPTGRCVRLAVHGWQGAGAMFHPWANYVSQATENSCDIVTLDLPGFGASPAPDSLAYENPLAYVMVLKGAVEYLKANYAVEKIGLVGHSMGGGLSVLYGLLYPEDLSDLDLISPWTSRETPLAKIAQNTNVVTNMELEGFNLSIWIASGPAAKKRLREYPEIWEGIRRPWYRYDALPPPNQIAYSEVRTRTARMDWAILQDLLKKNPKLAEELRKQLTISIARGVGDTVVPKKTIVELAQLLGIDPKEIVVFQGVGHHPLLAEPAKVEAFIGKKSDKHAPKTGQIAAT